MKKIGVYTIIADNFGAQLQAYATAKYLTSVCKGCSVELVKIKEKSRGKSWKRIVKSFLPSYIKKRKAYNDFERLFPLTSKSYNGNELVELPLAYDLYIVGSDQVWNVSEGMGDHLIYFLPFQTQSPKIALASSFGVKSIPESLKKELHSYLSDFSEICVRERDGVDILADINIPSQQILDPTFWIDRSEWEKLAGNIPIVKGDYIAAIGFETSYSGPQKLMNSVKDIYGVPIVGLNTYRRFNYDKRYDSFGPKEFLNVIKFAKLVVTSSFHTIVFSLMFQKDFYLLKHTKRNSRMHNLLVSLNLLDRMIDGESNDYIGILQEKIPIDYSVVDEKLLSAQLNTQKIINNIIMKYI